MPNRIKLQGFRQFENKLKRLPKEVRGEITEEIKDAGRKWEQGAKRDVPKDQGRAAQSIVSSSKELQSEVVAGVDYAPYIEWGTKTKARVPADISAYAAQFRGGKGGGDAKKMIYAWMNRVGIPKERQWIVFISIIVNGIKPQPFFFIQRPKVEADMIKNIKVILNTEH